MAALFTFGNMLTCILLILANTLQNSYYFNELIAYYQVFDNSGASNLTFRRGNDTYATDFVDAARGCTSAGFDVRHSLVDIWASSIRHCLYHFSPEAHWVRPLGMVPFRPRGTGTRRGVFLALLLLLSGNVAQNPGPICHPQVPSSTSINLASLNVRSAVGKSALIHNIIADDNIDVFALSETWIQQDAPSVIQQDPAPEGFRIIHVHRKITADGPTRGGGLAIISRDSIPVRTHPLASSFNPTSFELQLARVGSGPSTFTLVNLYRPPSQSKSVFIDEFLDIISTITATSGNDRLIVCGDANLPVLPGSSKIDADLHEALESV